MGSLQALHEALFQMPLWSVWGNSRWCQALFSASQVPKGVVITKHVWSYRGFPASTSRCIIPNATVKCLGELLVMPGFIRCCPRTRGDDQHEACLVLPWVSLAALDEALLQLPLWSVWGALGVPMLNVSQEPAKMINMKHVWWYRGYFTNTWRSIILNDTVRCLGEL